MSYLTGKLVVVVQEKFPQRLHCVIFMLLKVIGVNTEYQTVHRHVRRNWVAKYL
jgi:hypothetical protein